MNRPSTPTQMLRTGLKAGWAVALAGGLVLSGLSDLRAQEEAQPEEGGQPAWERIAEKLSPNSLEESSPEELPTVILPGDESGTETMEEELGEEAGEIQDEAALEAEAGEELPAAPPDVVQAAEAALEAGMEAAPEAAPEEGLEDGIEEGIAEEGAVEAEVEDMLQGRMDAAAPGTVGLPQAGGRQSGGGPNINLGRESQDTGQVANLFEDPEVRRMLGDNPRFIYGALRSPDPMIFPPVRNAAIYAELTAEAERLIKQGKLEEAQQCYKRILDLNDKRYALEMRNKIAQLNNRMGAARMILEDEAMIDVKLPPWVRTNTRGILYDETDPMVLVGDYTLRIGDPVPSHPEVRVEAVTKRTVTYRVADRQSFNVAVKGFQ